MNTGIYKIMDLPDAARQGLEKIANTADFSETNVYISISSIGV